MRTRTHTRTHTCTDARTHTRTHARPHALACTARQSFFAKKDYATALASYKRAVALLEESSIEADDELKVSCRPFHPKAVWILT